MKNLLVWAEIDRCVSDALSAVTGVSLGRRSLKYVDYGGVVATFLNISDQVSYRVVVRDETRSLADALYLNKH